MSARRRASTTDAFERMRAIHFVSLAPALNTLALAGALLFAAAEAVGDERTRSAECADLTREGGTCNEYSWIEKKASGSWVTVRSTEDCFCVVQEYKEAITCDTHACTGWLVGPLASDLRARVQRAQPIHKDGKLFCPVLLTKRECGCARKAPPTGPLGG